MSAALDLALLDLEEAVEGALNAGASPDDVREKAQDAILDYTPAPHAERLEESLG